LILLSLATLIGAVLRGLRLGELPGGYLAFNELFYIDQARQESARAPWDWFIHPLLYDKPPLYTGLVQMLYRLHLPEVAAARILSVAAGTATVILVFMLARLLYDERTALAAAFATSAMPGCVLVNHNIQVDSLFVALMMAALILYVLALRTRRLAYSVAAGCVLGLAILTKQPAVLVVLAIAAWDVWRTRDWHELLSRRFISFGAFAFAIGGSWYALQLLIAPRSLIAGMLSTGGRTLVSGTPWGFWSVTFASELAWMLFPLAAIVSAFGIAFMLWRRQAGDKLALVCLAIFLAYYIPFHLHSYYLLPAAPFFSIAIGRALMGPLVDGSGTRIVRWGLLAMLFAAMCLASLMMLSGQKWGYWSPMSLGNATTGRPYVVESNVSAFFGPGFRSVGTSGTAEVVDLHDYVATAHAGAPDLISFELSDETGAHPTPKVVLADTFVTPILFGYAVRQERWQSLEPVQGFTNSPWEFTRVGAPWEFGQLLRPWPSQVLRYDASTLAAFYHRP
jgi:4-amino-4-deoxy-L-arabinose transferase-like glycosyltransferase